MNKAQWAAIYNYCEEYGCTKQEILRALVTNGTVERGTKLEELGEYPSDYTYNAMINFLEENL